jgi:heptosyltransferase-2
MRYGLLNDIRPLDKSVLKQTVQRYVALGLNSDAGLPPDTPFPVLTVDTENQGRLIAKLDLRTDRPVVAFMPGAEYGPAKQWPVEYYAELARLLTEKNTSIWIFGSDKEKPLGDFIANKNEDVVNLCGRTSLTDVVDLLALTKECVTNDSGLMHVACATGRRVIAIYGSSDPAYTPPLSSTATIVYRGLDCSPCFERVCPLGHTQCLTGISAQDIYNTF